MPILPGPTPLPPFPPFIREGFQRIFDPRDAVSVGFAGARGRIQPAQLPICGAFRVPAFVEVMVREVAASRAGGVSVILLAAQRAARKKG